MTTQTPQVAVFGGGCFWCTEAVFSMLRGVSRVMPGYAGGATRDGKAPTYEQVSSGTTGHAEVIRIEFDPAQISFRELLTVFFATHNPTTLNRQGADVGSQYRSTILFTTPEQAADARAYIAELQAQFDASGSGTDRIVTEVAPLDTFYEAEDYHRDYYANNPGNPYCQAVIDPKLEKVKKAFKELLKKNS